MPLKIKTAATIDEVVEQLDLIIEWSISHSNRIGYFACLYRKVTIAVKDGIRQGVFLDGLRMERLDVNFANRFLEAFQLHQERRKCSNSWLLAFEKSGFWRPLVIQHLMLGMNAHINLDLGIAAAQTMRGKDIQDIKPDFFTINDILLGLIDQVQTQLSNISPLLRTFDMLSRFDEIIAGAGINRARSHAWSIAQAFAGYTDEEWESRIESLDQKTLLTGRRILQPGPGFMLLFGLLLIRLAEFHPVRRKIALLR